MRTPERLSVVDAAGRPLAGRPLASDEVSAERSIVIAGRTVARVQLARRPFASADVDAAFLARQYHGIVLTALLLTLLAVAGAVWAGRRWLRPVRAVQHAASRVAQGAFDVRLVPHGNDELADLSRDINAMAESLQQLEASRRRWLAELSHEMRTPLAVLRSEVEALVDGVRPLTPAAMLSLQEEVARVTRLVEEFHQLALSDLRALPCSFAPVQPSALLRAALAQVQPRAQAAGLQLALDDTGAPPLAYWDTQRIGQLLANLFENSLRYTDAPGRIALQLRPGDAGEAVLCIEDSAPGVPAADHPRLFEPLYRADASRSRRLGGSGLGLAICRAIAQSHGGRIEAGASTMGGLRVAVTLPLQPERGA
jgi:two-component system sensor histidine kinase BaeS